MTAILKKAFTGARVDRADMLRRDPDAFAAALADPAARVLVLDGLDPVLNEQGRLRWESVQPDDRPDGLVLLGLLDEAPHFARLSDAIPHGAAYAPAVWDAATILSADELALYGAARSVIDWHKRHRFCANCGSMTGPEKAGWARLCPSCGTEHFPRVDPVVIMLAQHEGRVLVGRQGRFAERRYSALAGFLEPGESIEEAVARELYEEAGITVHDVRYVVSQPWPFPSSLMIGCIAKTDDPTLRIDYDELEDAMWVDADDVRAALAKTDNARFHAPPPMAVARDLFLWWLDSQEGR